jgi:hypothetical protein
MDNGKLIIDKPDFKAYDLGITKHDGKLYRLRECLELIEGHWEGFVSMHPVKQEEQNDQPETEK